MDQHLIYCRLSLTWKLILELLVAHHDFGYGHLCKYICESVLVGTEVGQAVGREVVAGSLLFEYEESCLEDGFVSLAGEYQSSLAANDMVIFALCIIMRLHLECASIAAGYSRPLDLLSVVLAFWRGGWIGGGWRKRMIYKLLGNIEDTQYF